MQQPVRMLSLALVIAPFIGGCATYRPSPLDTAGELNALGSVNLEQFGVVRATAGGDPGQRNNTFDLSDGLDDSEVVAVALTLNPDLQAKRAEIGVTRAALITAGLWPNPEIGVSPKWGIGGATGVSVDADALFQLLRPGERDARQQAAGARVAATEADVVTDEFRLVSEVRAQRVSVLAAERLVALLYQVVGLRENALEIVRRQRQIGEGNELDVSATDLEVAQARRDVRKAEAELAAERRGLTRLMGLPPEYPVRLTGEGQPLKILAHVDLPDAELDHLLLAGRPEIRSGEAAYRQAEQELRLAVIQQYPRLGLGPAFEKELEGDKGLGLALSLGLPMFNQNQGEIAEKRAARDRARAQHVATLHRLKAEAVAARAELRIALSEVETQEREVLPLLRRNQELFEGAFKAREVNIITWLTAQQRAVDAQREYADSLIRYQRAVIRLETATGKPLARAASTQPTTNPSTDPS